MEDNEITEKKHQVLQMIYNCHMHSRVDDTLFFYKATRSKN